MRLWAPATPDLIGEPLVGHGGPVSAVAFSLDGTVLATGGHTVRLWLVPRST
ncbi:hypothetical protein [Streptomyces sp. NPDC090083]|uniref:hypothetical protein n=1 Tax=Streptomyces sp. NPDC090083 TaxID=3365941 RepID=UPI0037F32ABB